MAVQPRTRRSFGTAAALALLLTLGACGDDPETLEHVAVSASVTDPDTSQTTTVHGYVPDLALPAGTTLEAPLDDPVILAVDVTVAVGPDRGFSVRPSDFMLTTSSGDSVTALTSVNRALEDESLWPLLEVGSGSTLRGWLAFAVERGSVDGATLVAARPESMTVEGRGSLDAATFEVPLQPAG